MTLEEIKEWEIMRINRCLYEFKMMYDDDVLADAYTKLQKRLTANKEESSFCIEQEKAAYRRLIRNLVLFLVDLKGQMGAEKDFYDKLVADILH